MIRLFVHFSNNIVYILVNIMFNGTSTSNVCIELTSNPINDNHSTDYNTSPMNVIK